MTAKPPSDSESQPCAVLYVEDDDSAAYLFQKALEEEGVRLRLFRATDGEDALAFVRREGAYREAPAPHLVILDINLPKKNGFAVLSELQQIETLKHVPKVMFSSSTKTEDRERALALGADNFFLKNDWDAFVETAKSICKLLPSHGLENHPRESVPVGGK